MKNTAKLFGTQSRRLFSPLCAIALAAVVGLTTAALAGCGNEPDPEEPTVTSVTVSPSTPVVVLGGEKQFTATVTGTGKFAQTVTWSIETEGKDTGTAIDTNGKLTVAAAETLTSLTVKATSTVDAGKSGTATVGIYANQQSIPAVTGVTVSPATATVAKGGTVAFTATVAGTNSPAQTVTWSIVQTNKNAGTTIASNGTLTVAAGESLASLTVKATSTVDDTKSGTASVTVPGNSGSGGNGSIGNTITVNGEQVWTRTWTGENTFTESQFTGSASNLTHVGYTDMENMSDQPLTKPLSEAINGSPSVSIVNGKLSVSLGTPKAAVLYSLDAWKAAYPTITISASGAKGFALVGFTNDAYDYLQLYGHTSQIMYVYSDKNVTVGGGFAIENSWQDENGQTVTNTMNIVLAMDLKTGWNTVSQEYSDTGIFQRTAPPAADCKWYFD